jgi:aminoglycoside phosphotransferase (APT) family kinase protein
LNTNENIALGVGEVLAASSAESGDVQVVGLASAGATRTTVFIEVSKQGQTIPAVAQLRFGNGLELASAKTEASVLRLARDAGVAVPEQLGSGYSQALDAEILVTAHVDGETIPRRVLRALGGDTDAKERLTNQCASALARLHSIPAATVAAAIGDLAADQASPREITQEYLSQLSDSLHELANPYPTFRYGISYLATVLPDPAHSPALIHGDFRNGNLIVSSQGLEAVLDWELAHMGDPMEDLAWLCLRFWRLGNDDYSVGGFGSLARLRTAYEEAGGVWRQEAFDWWTMARTIWWGLGLAAQAKRFSEDLSTSIVHAASGRRVVELEYDLLKLIGESRGL